MSEQSLCPLPGCPTVCSTNRLLGLILIEMEAFLLTPLTEGAVRCRACAGTTQDTRHSLLLQAQAETAGLYRPTRLWSSPAWFSSAPSSTGISQLLLSSLAQSLSLSLCLIVPLHLILHLPLVVVCSFLWFVAHSGSSEARLCPQAWKPSVSG